MGNIMTTTSTIQEGKYSGTIKFHVYKATNLDIQLHDRSTMNQNPNFDVIACWAEL
jgi:hypothetical protein